MKEEIKGGTFAPIRIEVRHILTGCESADYNRPVSDVTYMNHIESRYFDALISDLTALIERKEREAFEAGRKGITSEDCGGLYETFEDYKTGKI